MFELTKTKRVDELIQITKSDSGVSGPELAKAHIELGVLLGEQMSGLKGDDTTVIAMLRGGVFFAEGIYFALGCKFQVYDPKHENFVRPLTSNVILVDSVVNTGKTILNVIEPDMYVACCVINEKAVPMFSERLYTVRVSTNSFVGDAIKKQNGSIGPDTTMRLFNQI